jgi:single-strand DNA-binding protein
MVNRVILIGRLGKDPEIRYTASGKAVCNFSIAINEGYGDKKQIEWIAIVLWEKTAEVAEKYLKKGSLVYIEGRLQTRSWEDKEGTTKYKTEVVGQRMQMLGGAGNTGTETGDSREIPF